MYLKAKIEEQIREAAAQLQAEGVWDQAWGIEPGLERPANAGHGDYATTLAMKLAKPARKPPRVLAQVLAQKLAANTGMFAKVEVAGPGFVNLHLSPAVLLVEAENIREQGENYGRADWGKGRKLLLEFVSANPTGPLNIVSARAAAVGDALARILKSQGVEVSKEYYINDAGNQALLLGESLAARYLQSLGEPAEIPDEGYQGEYIKDLALQIAEANKTGIKQTRQGADPKTGLSELRALFKEQGVEKIVAWHKRDLADFGVEFDTWFHELKLHTSGKVDAALNDLRSRGYIFEKDGAVWFRSTDFGDDKDRVLIKADGIPAYIAADIAYHRDKFERGFTELLDIWGPDHHGYIPRMKAAMQALGHTAEAFGVLIAQQVNLFEAGQPVAMSKRAGKFVTMADLIQDVGRDVARFFFLMRSTDAHLDFDLDLARKHTEENPVFYIQYAHARICSIIRKAEDEGWNLPPARAAAATTLTDRPEVFVLIRELAIFPEVLETCTRNFEPHGLAFYLKDLAAVFHRFYTECRVLDEAERTRSQGRLALVDAVRIVLENGLKLLGISAPESM